MGKPDDIEQRDWDAAGNEMGPPGVHVHPISYDLAHERLSRAIATARDEGRAEQRERDAGIAAARAKKSISELPDDGSGDAYWQGSGSSAMIIEAAIRKGEP